MKAQFLAELVSAYADHRTPAHRRALLHLFPEHADVLRELFDLTDALAGLFSAQAHRPAQAFRAELKRELLEEMERRRELADEPVTGAAGGRRYLAAAVGVGSAAVVVAAGAIVYWRHRTAMVA